MPAISNFRHLIFPIFYSAQHIRAALVFSQQRLSVQMSCLFQRFPFALDRLFADQRQADDIE